MGKARIVAQPDPQTQRITRIRALRQKNTARTPAERDELMNLLADSLMTLSSNTDPPRG